MLLNFVGEPLQIASDGQKMSITCYDQTYSILNPYIENWSINLHRDTYDITAPWDEFRKYAPGPSHVSMDLRIIGAGMVCGEGNIFQPYIDRLTVLELLKITREKLEKR